MSNEVAVRSSGEGPAVFCLHGLLGSSTQFDALADLTDHYRLAAWDAPGYGGSADAAPDATLSWYAARAAERIAADHSADNPAGVHVLGTGWGGMVAMQLAVEHPGLVRSLAVADSWLGPAGTPDAASRLDELGVPGLAEQAASAALSPAATAADAARIRAALEDGTRPEGVRGALHSIGTADLPARLRTVRIPTVVIAGEDAGAAAVQQSQDISAAVPEAVFVTMHAAGALTHLERPSTFAAWLRSFLYIVDKVREETA